MLFAWDVICGKHQNQIMEMQRLSVSQFKCSPLPRVMGWSGILQTNVSAVVGIR